MIYVNSAIISHLPIKFIIAKYNQYTHKSFYNKYFINWCYESFLKSFDFVNAKYVS